jgi:dihydrofolate reductase
MARIRVYIACSIDGFIAGDNDDLSWLPGFDGSLPEGGTSDPGAVDYPEFIKDVGAILMGRRSFDIASSFDGGWPYKDMPVVVATHRPLDPPNAHVRAVSGSIAEVIAEAKTTAAGKDVYLDGGIMIRAALDAGLVDHYIITVIPTALGSGIPLFHGIAQRARLKLVGNYRYWDNMFQLHFEPVRQP